MKSQKWAGRLGLALAICLCIATSSFASPWAEVGDNQLRGDIEILAAAGVIDDVTTHWPLPWQSIVKDLRGNSAGRTAGFGAGSGGAGFWRGRGAENSPGLSASLDIDAATTPSVVYGFDGMGRGDGQGQFVLDYNSQSFAARLALGGFTQNFRGNSTKLDAGPVLSRGEIRARPGLWRLSFALVGPGMDFGPVAVQQCPSHAADRIGAAGHFGLEMAGAALAGALAVGILRRPAGRAAPSDQYFLQRAAVHV